LCAVQCPCLRSLLATAGAVNFDLSGTGTTPGFAVRGTRAGGGIGFGHQSRDGSQSVTNLTLSTAGGVRAYLTDRMALLGEFRMRGIQRDFSGTTAELMGGLSFAIGR